MLVCYLHNFCQTFFSLLFLLPLLRLKIPATKIFFFRLVTKEGTITFYFDRDSTRSRWSPVLRALHAFVGKITISICIDERTFVEKINFGNCLEEIRVVSCWLCRHLPENNCCSIICFTLEHPRWCLAFPIWNIYLNVKCTLDPPSSVPSILSP